MHTPALILIDVQKGLDEPRLGRRNNPQAEANMARLLAIWRKRGLPVLHVKHNSVEPTSALRPELPGNAIKDEVRPLPEEPVFDKTVNSAFIGTNLEGYLRKERIASLVIVGLTTDHCVSASVRMASDLGFDVTVISDATAAHEKTGFNGVRYTAEQIHWINLVSLDGEFCRVKSTDDVLARLKET